MPSLLHEIPFYHKEIPSLLHKIPFYHTRYPLYYTRYPLYYTRFHKYPLYHTAYRVLIGQQKNYLFHFFFSGKHILLRFFFQNTSYQYVHALGIYLMFFDFASYCDFDFVGVFVGARLVC